MLDAVVLYGSKARNEGEADSDTDLMGIVARGKIDKAYDAQGVSLHLYPKAWLLDQAKKGSLFLLHVTMEGRALYDPLNLLKEIGSGFQAKSSYLDDIEVGARVAFAMTERGPLRPFSNERRARYFWGIRTALMAAAANHGTPAFSAKALEEFSGVDGLASHINTRKKAELAECQYMASRVVASLRELPPGFGRQEHHENLRALLRFGGIAAVTAGHEIYGS